MTLTDSQRVDVWAEFMRQISAENEPIELIKSELRAVVDAIDDGLVELQRAEKAALRGEVGLAIFAEFERVEPRPDPPPVRPADLEPGEALADAEARRDAEIARYRGRRAAVDAIRASIDLGTIRARESVAKRLIDRQIERIAVLCQHRRAGVPDG